MIYKSTVESYELLSYGEDGMPGGTGQDADIYNGQPLSEKHLLTFRQFSRAWNFGQMQLWCALAGAIAGSVCFLSKIRPPVSRSSLVKAAITAAFAIVVAIAMSFLHLPSGH